MTTNEDRIRSYFAACSSGSSSEVASHFTEDAVIYDTNHPPIMSAEAIGDFWAQICDKWEGARWIVERVVSSGETAAIEWRMDGINRVDPRVSAGGIDSWPSNCPTSLTDSQRRLRGMERCWIERLYFMDPVTA